MTTEWCWLLESQVILLVVDARTLQNRAGDQDRTHVQGPSGWKHWPQDGLCISASDSCLPHPHQKQKTWLRTDQARKRREIARQEKGMLWCTQGGKGNVDGIFWSRIKKLVKIVIPGWQCPEVFDLLLLSVFLVFRTFLSVYLASVNGRIVQAIIDRNLSLFIRRVKMKIVRSSD